MAHGYERIGTFLPEEVLPFIPAEDNKQVVRKYAGKGMSLNKKKLRIFALKGIDCVCCGIKGTLFAVEKLKGATRWHFNVYAINATGGERQITIDHDIPKSLGGTRALDNLQPMCEVCNRRKGNNKKYYISPADMDSSWLPSVGKIEVSIKLEPKLRPFVVKKKLRIKYRYEQLCFKGKAYKSKKEN